VSLAPTLRYFRTPSFIPLRNRCASVANITTEANQDGQTLLLCLLLNRTSKRLAPITFRNEFARSLEFVTINAYHGTIASK
jgi:hypothetical protein